MSTSAQALRRIKCDVGDDEEATVREPASLAWPPRPGRLVLGRVHPSLSWSPPPKEPPSRNPQHHAGPQISVAAHDVAVRFVNGLNLGGSGIGAVVAACDSPQGLIRR